MDARRLRKIVANLPVRYDQEGMPQRKVIVVDLQTDKDHLQELLIQIGEEDNVTVMTQQENCSHGMGTRHGVSGNRRTSGWDAATFDYALEHGMS